MNSSTSSSEHQRAEGLAARYTRIAIAVAFTTSAAFALASLYLIVAIVLPQDDLEKRLALLDAAAAESAAFGDSKMANAFVGGPNFLNLAYPAENTLDMRLASALYFEGRKPHRVILQAGPHQLSYYRLSAPARGYLVAANERSLWRDHHRAYLFAYWSALLTKGRLENTGGFGEFGLNERYGDQSKQPIEARRLEARKENSTDRPHPEFHGHPHTSAYRGLVEDLVSRGAEVCLVTLPVSKEFHELAMLNPDFASAFRYFQDVADESRIPYVNAFSLLSGEKDLHLFNNADHLNVEGARWLSDYVMKHCYGAPPKPTDGSTHPPAAQPRSAG